MKQIINTFISVYEMFRIMGFTPLAVALTVIVILETIMITIPTTLGLLKPPPDTYKSKPFG